MACVALLTFCSAVAIAMGSPSFFAETSAFSAAATSFFAAANDLSLSLSAAWSAVLTSNLSDKMSRNHKQLADCVALTPQPLHHPTVRT